MTKRSNSAAHVEATGQNCIGKCTKTKEKATNTTSRQRAVRQELWIKHFQSPIAAQAKKSTRLEFPVPSHSSTGWFMAGSWPVICSSISPRRTQKQKNHVFFFSNCPTSRDAASSSNKLPFRPAVLTGLSAETQKHLDHTWTRGATHATFHPSSSSAYWCTAPFKFHRVLIDGSVVEHDPRCTSRLPFNFQANLPASQIDSEVGTPGRIVTCSSRTRSWIHKYLV